MFLKAKARDRDQIDLLIVRDGNEILAGYELKVNRKTVKEIDDALTQGEKYSEYYGCKVYVINFWPEGTAIPKDPTVEFERVILVNVQYSSIYSTQGRGSSGSQK